MLTERELFMQIDINQVVEIDPLNDKTYEPLLNNLQGNILKGHGRDHSIQLFLRFTNIPNAKKWLGEFSKKYVTSALQQAQESQDYRDSQKQHQGTIFANVFLTISGYKYLEFVKQGEEEFSFKDKFFAHGMKDPQNLQELADPPIQQWEHGFQDTIHAMILLADDNLGKLLQIMIKEFHQFITLAQVVHVDYGFVLRNSDKKVIEHFGFRDGVSQPLFYKRDIEKERKYNPINFTNWNPRAPLSLVLLKDPFGTTPESYGSYLVYRKLEQNVKGWNKDVEELAKTLNIKPDLAGAYVMGRFQDGTPVVLSNEQLQSPEAAIDNFNFQEDTQGAKCPFHAHIRKTNPRGDTGNLLSEKVPLEQEKMKRIVRRGVSYGEHDLTKPLETDSGLLFMCFQADINNQFALMQRDWSNSRDFIKQGTGSDPVIGQIPLQKTNTPPKEPYEWPATWGKTEERIKADFSHWVNFKGGEYFFAPSMSFLISLISN